MEEAFRAILTTDTAVKALVPASRINWGAHPQGAPLPAVVLHLIGDGQGGTYQGSDGLWQGRVQVDVYAGSYGDAAELGSAVYAALNNYRAGKFQLIAHDGAMRATREGGSNEADRPFRRSMDFFTKWSAS